MRRFTQCNLADSVLVTYLVRVNLVVMFLSEYFRHGYRDSEGDDSDGEGIRQQS